MPTVYIAFQHFTAVVRTQNRVCSATPPDRNCYRKYDETHTFSSCVKNIGTSIPAFPGTQRVLTRFLEGQIGLLLLLFVLWVGSSRSCR